MGDVSFVFLEGFESYWGCPYSASDVGEVLAPMLVVPLKILKKHQAIPISRPNFLELCDELVEIDEELFEQLFRRLGLSVDWKLKYATIDERSRRISQRAFL